MCYNYYYTREYLPTRYEADDIEWANRRAVWNFKDGNCSPSVLNDLVECIDRIVGNESTYDYVICFIPASTRSKTRNRYSSVARQLSNRTGVEATLAAITKDNDSESGYISGKSDDPADDFSFDSDYFRGKKVILIDDVITRGRTFSSTARRLISNGASSVVGLFVAKTVNPDWNSSVA